jgi:hypothetical protein
MRLLRAVSAVTAPLLALFAVAVPLAAQEQWDDARTLELVRAATARRALQLADTGLRDYTARATGTLSFLTQFGEGILARPLLVRADQLELEVYWGAPNRSKQRIVGRRDTLLLPNDQQYHRDHLGIIQNNFPDVIRLGDGDEVLDVPHPLSPLGPRTYEYRISDSLSIRGSGIAVDVIQISVRPRNPAAPAAVGAVHIDRASSAVVRMTFSFTRASLRDPRLDDVSVILENGLVDGRYWLPRRQEIEVRRSVSWMDFPGIGIIRGRWEICCVQTNLGLAAPTFSGAEIVEAGPRERLRNFPFEREVLEALPEDVRALDAPEVRAVQEEARRLVRAGALARARSGNLFARGLSDFVRSDRVEGLALGAGLSQRFGGGFEASLTGRYGTVDERWKGRGELRWQGASGVGLSLARYDDWQQLGEVQEVSGLRNSIAAQEFGSDWSQPMYARGGALGLQFARSERGRIFLEASAQTEDAAATGPGAVPAFGRFERTVSASDLRRRALTLGFDRANAPVNGGVEWRASVRLTNSRWTSQGGNPQPLRRANADLELNAPALGGRLRLRTIAAGITGADFWPEQDYVRLGGPICGPGYDFHSFVAQRGVSQRVEWQYRVPFLALDLGRFGRVPGTLVLAPYVHAVWLDRERGVDIGAPTPLPPSREGWSPAIGLGTIGVFDLLRVDVARGLRNGRWTFSVDVARSLWPVL